MIKRKITNLILMLTLFSAVYAEPIKLSLDKACEIALENNPQLKLAKESVEKASLQIDEARSGMMPTVSAFGQLQHAWNLQENKIPNFLKDGFDQLNYNLFVAGLIPSYEEQDEYLEMAFGLENTIVYGLSFELPIYTGGAIWNGYQMAKLGKDMSEVNLVITRNSVLTNLHSAYYGVLFVESAAEVSQEALDAAKENLDLVKKMYDAGKATNFDLLRAEVEVANRKPSLISASNQIKIAKSQLATLLGYNKDVELELTGDLVYIKTPLLEKNLEELYEIADAQRLEIDLMIYQKEMSKKQLSLAFSAALPKLAFSTSYQNQGMRNDFKFISDDFNNSLTSSLGLSIPIFNGLKNSSKIQQSKVAIREADIQYQSALDGIHLEVKSTYLTLKEAQEKVLTQEKTIDQSVEAMRLAKLMYSEGAGTQLDVLNAQLAVNLAKMNYQQSLFEYNVALASLKKAINQL